MGENSTDLAVVYGDAPRLVRTIPTGVSSLVRAAVQNLNVQDTQARQFILKFGLAPDRLDGQVLKAIDSVLDNFTSEIVKSVKFFQTRYPNLNVGGIYLSGFGAVIPQMDAYVATKTNIQSAPADSWQRVAMSPDDKQQLAPIASEFATVVGLAQRRNSV
jgi:Tfp pilus assembly PilM family ATPase